MQNIKNCSQETTQISKIRKKISSEPTFITKGKEKTVELKLHR